MLSKSTKTKRRRNHSYYALVAKIKVLLIDQRHGNRYYLISLPRPGSDTCIHLEARGEQERKKAYRQMREGCRRYLESV